VANNIDLEIVNTEPQKGVSDEYLKINALGKIPTFVGADGFILNESIAIAIYSMSTLFPLVSSISPCAMMNNIVNSLSLS